MDTQLDWNLSKVVSTLDTKPSPWGLIGRLVLVDKLTPKEVEELTWYDVIDCRTGKVGKSARIGRDVANPQKCTRKAYLSSTTREAIRYRWLDLSEAEVRWVNHVTAARKDGVPIRAEIIFTTINRAAKKEIGRPLLTGDVPRKRKRRTKRDDIRGQETLGFEVNHAQ